MTPSEFLKLYTDMSVCIVPPDGDVTDNLPWTKVQVKKYHLGLTSFRAVFWQDLGPKVAKGAKVRVKTIEGRNVTSDLLNSNQIFNLFRYPFSGKGSPEQVQATIQLMFRFRKNKSTVEQFAGGTGLQTEYNFIGLDCNGFVGNYLQRVIGNKYNWWNQDNGTHPGPDSKIRDLFNDTTNPLYAMTDFQSRGQSIYQLVYCSPEGKIYDNGDGPGGAGHIMISDPGVTSYSKDEVRFTVSESTAADIGGSGGGPVTSEYIVKRVVKAGDKTTRTGAIFAVWRGGSPHLEMNVKIGSLR